MKYSFKRLIALAATLVFCLSAVRPAAVTGSGAIAPPPAAEPAGSAQPSAYTVELTLEGREYVLPGGSRVLLAEALAALGLTGEVSAHAVSDRTLFDLLPGSEAEGGALYFTSLRPFSTREWLDVTVDGRAYRITVTDDATTTFVDQYKKRDGTLVPAPGVVQGGNEDNFTNGMPLATIFIDENVISMDPASRNSAIPKKLGVYATRDEFEFKNPTTYGGADNVFLSFNVKKASDNGRALTVAAGSQNNFPGDIVQYTFKDGAQTIDPITGAVTKHDVVITYSNLLITTQTANSLDVLNLGLFAGNMVGIGASAAAGSKVYGENRYAIQVDVNIKVVKSGTGDQPDPELVGGTFYFPMVDLDVKRTANGWSNLHDSAARNYYSEQVRINDGLASALYIPGGDFDPNQTVHTGILPNNTPDPDQRNFPYLSAITNDNGTLRVVPDLSYNDNKNPKQRDKDFYTGFAALADNTGGGIDLTYWGSSASLNGN